PLLGRHPSRNNQADIELQTVREEFMGLHSLAAGSRRRALCARELNDRVRTVTAPQLVPSEEVQSPRRRRTPPVAIRNVAPIETLAPLVAYSFALLIPMVAWIATMVFALYIKNLVFIFFWPAVIFVAVLGGFGPAFVAALWSSVLAANFIVPPLRGLSPGSPPELARFIGFFATSLFVGLLTHTLQDERRRAGEAARENARLARQLEQQAMALEQQLE